MKNAHWQKCYPELMNLKKEFEGAEIRVSSIIDRIEPEPEYGDTSIDELVATGVNIHIERLSDGTFWLGIEKDGVRQVVTFATRRDALIVARTDKE